MNAPGEYRPQMILLTVNGVPHELDIGNKAHQVAPWDTLTHTLRTTLGLLGTKVGCNRGSCASCTVLMDGGAHPRLPDPDHRMPRAPHHHHRRTGRRPNRRAGPPCSSPLWTTPPFSAVSAHRG